MPCSPPHPPPGEVDSQTICLTLMMLGKVKKGLAIFSGQIRSAAAQVANRCVAAPLVRFVKSHFVQKSCEKISASLIVQQCNCTLHNLDTPLSNLYLSNASLSSLFSLIISEGANTAAFLKNRQRDEQIELIGYF